MLWLICGRQGNIDQNGIGKHYFSRSISKLEMLKGQLKRFVAEVEAEKTKQSERDDRSCLV
jgi:hypothetical protein